MPKDKGGHGSDKRQAGFAQLAGEMRKYQEPKKRTAPKTDREKGFDRLAAEMRQQARKKR